MPDFMRREELEFLLHEVLDVDALAERPLHAGQDREVWGAVIDNALRLAETRFLPHAAKLDAEEPRFDGTRVHVIPEVAEALAAYRDAGFPAASFAEELGGMQLPATVSAAVGAVFSAANVATTGYVFLTAAAANLLAQHGSAELKDRYLDKLVSAEWFGTMALSEPHAGSSLADIRTRAEPREDGTWRLRGRKMWISGGEHDLAPNIVHFMLARTREGGGVKGISLFCVPKILPDGTRNEVDLIGLNHKLGYRGTVNAALAVGDRDGATGWLVGEEGQGLAAMFTMMNEARIGVGAGAAALGYAGWMQALAYAKERTQGRPLSARDPAAPMIPIAEHPDVRRMLLEMKALTEGGLALCLYAARLVDETRTNGPEGLEAEALLDLLTPMVKSWPSEFCLKANDIAIQVFGGAGYTRDWPVERLWRDNRLNPIHEGTKGVQGLDLLGRKVRQDDGRGLRLLMDRISSAVTAAADDPGLAEERAALAAAAAGAAEVTEALMGRLSQEGPEAGLGDATLYLDMLGHVTVGWLWLEQALAAGRGLAAGADGARRSYLEGKRAAARFFLLRTLAEAEVWRRLLARGDRVVLDTAVAAL